MDSLYACDLGLKLIKLFIKFLNRLIHDLGDGSEAD